MHSPPEGCNEDPLAVLWTRAPLHTVLLPHDAAPCMHVSVLQRQPLKSKVAPPENVWKWEGWGVCVWCQILNDNAKNTHIIIASVLAELGAGEWRLGSSFTELVVPEFDLEVCTSTSPCS